ncbi:MAG TPA: AVAST type 1 anti-phage system protein Avs1c [Kofleriaceae bacterium]|nr:AVAST type 1 anti-phage system protein Avs1c [Kofleriaceae bacterium]
MITLMRSRPFSRESFERNLFILREIMMNGRLFHLRGLPMEGLLRVRELPNGRIDLLSVDELTRLKANMMAEFDGPPVPIDSGEDADQSVDEDEKDDLDAPSSDEDGSDDADFAENLVDLCVQGDEQAAVESLQVRFEAHLRSGEFGTVDQLLSAIEADRLPSSVLVAALSITFSAKSVLGARAQFLHRVEEWLRTAIGPERTEKLLANRR